MKKEKLILLAFLVLVVCLAAGCVGMEAMGPRVKISQSATPYVSSLQVERLPVRNFDVRAVDLRESLDGRPPYLEVAGEYAIEYFGWNIDRRGIADDVYKNFVPGYVKHLAEILGPDFKLSGFVIYMRVNIITDRDKYFNEELCKRIGRGCGHVSPRVPTKIDYVVGKQNALLYSKFSIDSTTLRERMSIIIDGKERVR